MKNILLICFTLILFTTQAEEVKIQADKTEGCAPLTVNFSTVSSGTGVTWSWDFGNGHTSNIQSPSVAFLKPGVYEVNLFVNSQTGISSVGTVITVNAPPNADFKADKTKACANESINFMNQSSPGAAPITKSVWGFGDGKAATVSNAQHRYSAAGDYNITLVVTDANGCSADKTSFSSLTVYPKPVAFFTPSVPGSCNETQQVSFSNQSKGNDLKFKWNFGDRKTSYEITPSHLFLQGKHDVTLAVNDANGCSDTSVKNISVTKLKADFKSSKDNVCTGEAMKFINASNFKGDKWEWDFGDGTVSAVSNPEKTYLKPGTYSVRFTVTDGTCSGTELKKSFIRVVPGNPVSFVSEFAPSCTSSVRVKFQNTTPNTAISLWEFGDGTVSNDPSPEKIFSGAGNYNITLSVTDSTGHTVKKEIDNFIQTSKPLVRFTGDTSACAGYPLKFSNLTPNATAYLWNFGDGETSTQKNPSHIYKKNGYYSVSLTASNGNGCDSAITMNIHINEIKADFDIVSTPTVVPPFVCTFTNRTKQANVKYVWDFGDGTSEISKNPVHLYDVPGNFKVRLVAYAKSGCSNSKVVEHSLQVGTTENKTVVHGGL